MWNVHLLYRLHARHIKQIYLYLVAGPVPRCPEYTHHVVDKIWVDQKKHSMITITLTDIRAHNPCQDRWKRLLKGLGVTHVNNKPLPLERVLEINGLGNALWALKAVQGHDEAIRLFACNCAKYVIDIYEQEHPTDIRPREGIETAELFTRGEATKEKLASANYVVMDAAGYAAQVTAMDAAEIAEMLYFSFFNNMPIYNTRWGTAGEAIAASSEEAALYAAAAGATAMAATEGAAAIATAGDAYGDAIMDAAGSAAWCAAWCAARSVFKLEFIRMCRLREEYAA